MSENRQGQTMLRGDLIDLRPVWESDLDSLEAWAADPDHGGEFNTFALYRPGDITRAFAEHGYLAESRGMLMIVTRAGELTGDVSYRTVSHGPGPASQVPEIGITIAVPFRGRGYGAEAQKLLAAYLLDTRPVARIQATTDITNIAEQRALARAGFTREGVLRRAQFRHGDWHDLVIYSKLRGE
jgi:aminoglycoside 6'-N-acetyltransferase